MEDFPKRPIESPQETEKQIPEWFKVKVKEVLDAYFEPKDFESEGVYKRLGVGLFKKYLPTSGDVVTRLLWRRLWKKSEIRKDITSLENAELLTKCFEGFHAVFFAVLAFVAGRELAGGSLDDAITMTAVNGLVNLYPVMLQRYNRLRFEKTKKKIIARESGKLVKKDN